MAGEPASDPQPHGQARSRRVAIPPKVFNCPTCGAGLLVRAQGQTLVVVCRSCGSTIDVTDENYRILSTVKAKTTLEPLIPLGTRGKCRGHTWEAIGFMQRCDSSGIYCWREYLLFNPYQGFRWLT